MSSNLEWLAAWFRGRGPQSPASDVNFVEEGFLRSLELIELITAIEEHFPMQFLEDDFGDPRFYTLSGLAELIAERSP